MYSKKLLQYFKSPKNVGKLKDADGIGRAGNPLCGDQMLMYLKVKSLKSKVKSPIIADAKFETLGCAAAIAMSDRVIELVKGKTLDEVKSLRPRDIAEGFDLPPTKVHCSVLGIEALKAAIDDYEKRATK